MSRFSVRGPYGPHSGYELRDTQSDSLATILAGLGATLHTLQLGSRTVVAGDPPEHLAENPQFRGRVLAPFNDRIPGGRYTFDGDTYHLPVNEPESDSAIHGLVYDKAFTVIATSETDTAAHLSLYHTLSPGEHRGYPFTITVGVTYRLSGSGLEIELRLLNEGDRPAPVSVGLHPYIDLSNAAKITCEAPSYVAVNEALLPTGDTPQTAGSRYELHAAAPPIPLDIALVRPRREFVTTTIDRGEDTIIVEQQRDPFAYTQLFLPEDRRSLAVEPISAATNAFNLPELGLIRLPATESVRGLIRIRRE